LFTGDWKKAHSCYQQSLDAFEADGESDNLACVAYQSLGRLFVLQRQFSQAIPLLERGIAIRRHRQEQKGIAENAIHLATAYLECNKLREAEALLNEAMQICREIDDRMSMALCHSMFGSLEAKMGNMEGAIVQWQQALDLLRAAPMPSIELQILAMLLPQLLRTGRIRELLLASGRALSAFYRQKLSPLAIVRLIVLNAPGIIGTSLNRKRISHRVSTTALKVRKYG